MNTKKRLYIRVDASPIIGLGHLTRCQALAKIINAYFEVTFCCREIPDRVKTSIEEVGADLLMLEDESSFTNILSKDDLVVLDGYHFSSNYHLKLKEKGCIIIILDDVCNITAYHADLIINHSPGFLPSNYPAEVYSMFALGLEYALLRDSFLRLSSTLKQIQAIEKIAICFGGADPENLTKRVLQCFIELDLAVEINVVTGASYPYLNELMMLFSSYKNIRFHNSLSEKEMCSLFLESDLAVVPASGILLEAMTTNCFIITGVYIENQRLLYERVIDDIQIFDAADFSVSAFSSALKKVLTKHFPVISKQMKLVGDRTKTLAKIFNQLGESVELSLRRVNHKDIDIIYQWANNPEIRVNSFSKNVITREEHENWFAGKLQDTNCCFYIVEKDFRSVGLIRFDITSENKARISYLVDPIFHGKGYGTTILYKGIKKFIAEDEAAKVKEIQGEVLNTNLPSIKAFQRLGFEALENNNYICFKKIINII